MKPIPKIALSLALVAFAVCFSLWFFPKLIEGPQDLVALLFYIPLLCVTVLLPLISGVLLLVDLFRKKAGR
jgi:hypothetical protein